MDSDVRISFEALTALLGHKPEIGETVNFQEMFRNISLMCTAATETRVTVEFEVDGKKYQADFPRDMVYVKEDEQQMGSKYVN